jgi:membrane-associated phospholipid phosphatase
MIKTLLAAHNDVRRPTKLIIALAFGILFCALYPTDLKSYPIQPAGTEVGGEVSLTENYLRFVPTAIQIAVPLLLGDKIGMVQLIYVGIVTTVATHSAKHFFNDRWANDTRLGQRPSGTGSKHNMPSGHSSMAASAVYFIGRRYSIQLALLMSVFLMMTMYARVMLNDHTISAVIAGALLGLLTTALVTSQYQPKDLVRV